FHNGTGREESEGWEEIPEEAASRDKKKKHAKKSIKTYKIYIFKVLNQIYPDIRISSKAMGIMNTSRLVRYKKKPTIISWEIHIVVSLYFLVSWPSTLFLSVPRLLLSLLLS
ncbi:hypothetical protein CUMW_234780, partial [Citrus unshiu]